MGSFQYPDVQRDMQMNQQVVFQRQFESIRRDEVVGVLLALFLGCFGLHHFTLAE